MKTLNKQRHLRRESRTRNKLRENKERARLTVSRSNNGFYAQIIDDKKGFTITSISFREVEQREGLKKAEIAEKMGEQIALKAKEKKISAVVFDKGGYKYHGRVKAFADGARKGGLNF